MLRLPAVRTCSGGTLTLFTADFSHDFCCLLSRRLDPHRNTTMRTTSDDAWDEDDFESDVDDCDNSVSDEDAEEPTVQCGTCGCEMLEIVLQCPSCGDYSSKESHWQTGHPRWVLLTVILCLGTILYLWMF